MSPFFAMIGTNDLFVTVIGGVSPPDPIPDDDALAVLMLALSPDMYLRHADVEGEVLADSSSGGANPATVVGTMAAWGVDPGLASPANPERAITYGGTGSSTVDPTPAGTVTYGIRLLPNQMDIDNQAAIFERAVSGNSAGYWGLRFMPGGAVRLFMQTGAASYAIQTAEGLIEAGKWAHIYVVFDATGAYLYINGTLIDSNLSFQIGETGNDQPLKIGSSFFTDSFNGTVHEVVRYPSALTGPQITARTFYDTLTTPPVGDTYAQMPTTTSTVSVSSLSALTNAINTAAPGTRIEVAAGNYGFMAVTFAGEHTLPIVVCPADKNNPPVFTGNGNQIYGTHGEFWGIVWDNTAGGALPGTRNIQNYGQDIKFMYNDIRPAGIGIEVRSTGTRRMRVERCRVWDQPAYSGTANGFEAIKLGVSTSLPEPHASVVTLSRFEGLVAERETIGFKGDAVVSRCHFDGCREISFRYCQACSLIECRIENPSGTGRIQVNGPDNIIRGNVGTQITVDRGTLEGDAGIIPSSGSTRLAAKRTILQNNVMPSGIKIGDDPFSSSLLYPTTAPGMFTEVSGNTASITLVNGETTTAAPSVTSETPPTLTSSTTGIIAYAAQVTAA